MRIDWVTLSVILTTAFFTGVLGLIADGLISAWRWRKETEQRRLDYQRKRAEDKLDGLGQWIGQVLQVASWVRRMKELRQTLGTREAEPLRRAALRFHAHVKHQMEAIDEAVPPTWSAARDYLSEDQMDKVYAFYGTYNSSIEPLANYFKTMGGIVAENRTPTESETQTLEAFERRLDGTVEALTIAGRRLQRLIEEILQQLAF